MKLVEILAKELSEWPDDMWSAIGQAKDGDLHAEPFSGRHLKLGISVAEDHMQAIVSRNEWQAERDRQKGGEWKRHRGGKQPVANEVLVEFKFRSGVTGACYASDLLWDHQKQDDDVMQYRIISQPQAEEVEVKDTTIGTLSYKVEIDTTEASQAIDELTAKWDQVDGPLLWRDTVNELDAYIEEFTRERDELIERLASEGFALIPAMNAVMGASDISIPIEEWEIGDIVEVISVSDQSGAPLGIFKITDIDSTDPKYELDDQYFPNHDQMKFVRRP